MMELQMKYVGNLNEGLMKFIEGLKTSAFDKNYNAIILNVTDITKKHKYQVDRVYGSDLTKIDFDSELYGMINDGILDEHLVGEFTFELIKYYNIEERSNRKNKFHVNGLTLNEIINHIDKVSYLDFVERLVYSSTSVDEAIEEINCLHTVMIAVNKLINDGKDVEMPEVALNIINSGRKISPRFLFTLNINEVTKMFK